MVDERLRSETQPDSLDEVIRQVVQLPRVNARLGGPLPLARALAGGRLQLVRTIGAGGMGVVYEAHDEERGRVALKTLSHMDATGIYRLKNEFRTLADVRHPNLVQLHELFADGDLWFFTMDLIEGVAFDAWVRPQEELDERRLRSSLQQLADAVLAIHGAGKLHRDLKPSNALVKADGSVVVLDFGLAMDPAQGAIGHTLDDGSFSGTPGYTAPEQAATQPLTAACDWYGVGVMLFEALTGRLPFEGKARDVLIAKQTRRAPAPSELTPRTPQDLDRLCSELLERDPAQRPVAEQLRKRLGLSSNRSPRTHAPNASESSSRPTLFGRASAQATLRAAFDATLPLRKPVVVCITGESGIGKSALVNGFLAELGTQAVVLSGRCYERESLPYKAFDGLIDELSRYLRRLPADRAAGLMPRDVWALRRLFPVLGRVPAIFEAPERGASDSADLRNRGFLALGELLGRMRDRQPVALAIDDLQWADEDSIALIVHLLRQPDAPRLLMILSHRAGPPAALPLLAPLYETLPGDIRLDLRRLELEPLADAASREVIRAQLGAEPADSPNLAREAGGNPFILTELLRARERSWRGSLADLLGERIAQLLEPERELLELLAVAGRPLRLDQAAAALQLSAARAIYESLRAAQLACASGQPHTIECYHDKIREAVARILPAARERALHRKLAEALELDSDADPEHLCLHWDGAGESARAAERAGIAARKAAAALAFGRAESFYERALASDHWSASERQQLRVARAEMLAHAGRGAIAGAAYLEALESADDEQALELKRKAAEQYVYSGHLARGRALLHEALAPLGIRVPRSDAAAIASLVLQRARLSLRGYGFRARPTTPPAVARHLAALRGAGSAMIRSDPVRGTDLLLRHLRLALDAGEPVEAGRGLSWQFVGGAFTGLGEEQMRAIASLAERLSVHTGDIETRAMLHYGRGLAAIYDAGSLAEFEQSIALLREHASDGSYYNRAQAEMLRALLQTFRGELQLVARQLPAHIDEAYRRGDLVIVPMWAGAFSLIARLAVSDLEGATRDLTRARKAWPDQGFTFQDFALCQGEMFLARYQGDAAGAWSVMERYWPRFRASPLRRVAHTSNWMHMHRGEVAVMLATPCREPRARADLLELAGRMAAQVSLAPKLTVPLRAALACQRGQLETAQAILSAGVATMPTLWAEAARSRLGALLGGETGLELVRRADTFFQVRGVTASQQLVAALMPGCEPPVA